MAIHPAPTDLCPIIGQAVEAAGVQLARKNLTISVEAPAQLDLYADGNRLQQVSDNLLSNAVKRRIADTGRHQNHSPCVAAI